MIYLHLKKTTIFQRSRTKKTVCKKCAPSFFLSDVFVSFVTIGLPPLPSPRARPTAQRISFLPNNAPPQLPSFHPPPFLPPPRTRTTTPDHNVLYNRIGPEAKHTLETPYPPPPHLSHHPPVTHCRAPPPPPPLLERMLCLFPCCPQGPFRESFSHPAYRPNMCHPSSLSLSLSGGRDPHHSTAAPGCMSYFPSSPLANSRVSRFSCFVVLRCHWKRRGVRFVGGKSFFILFFL